MIGSGEIGFRGIKINGPKGPITVVPDQNCPVNRIFGVTMKHMKLRSLGKLVKCFESDGLPMLRQATADGVEVRYLSYHQLTTGAPGAHINIQF